MGERRGRRSAGRAALMALAVPFVTAATPIGAQVTERGEAEVLGVVHALFDAMREKDEAALRSVFHPEARLLTAGEGADGAPTVGSTPIEGFIRGVMSSDAHLDERLWDEEVRVSGPLATVWTRYGFWADGTFSHCGVDAFQLARTEAGWQIVQVADTRQREGCEIPDGVRPGG